MDIPQVLAVLRPDDDWGPCAQSDSTYAEFEQGWLSRHGPDDPPPTEAEILAVWADLESTRAAREATARRAAAVQLLLTSDEPRDVALRAFLRDLYTMLNDERESRGLPRQLEPEIIGRVVTGIAGGLGDAA